MSAPASAQLSPGPLARAHHELEGTLKCLECHRVGKGTLSANCIACHEAIQRLHAEGHGLHGQANLPECSYCHPEHRGEDFDLVHWEEGTEENFPHERTGWPLTGQHAKLACRQCHRPKYQLSPVISVRRGGFPEESWLGLERKCSSCHADPHEGRLGPKCAQCHTTASFALMPNQGFDHEVTRFPLRGKHTGVDCEKCHDPVKGKKQLPAFEKCSSCHADPHGGRATIAGNAVDCEACHRVDGFRPSTFTASDHARTSYPLEGKHARVRCERCHRPADSKARPELGSAGVVIHPRHTECASCHDDPHGGQLLSRPDRGACESCHTVKGFRPSTFTAADHAKLRFPLKGSHGRAECRTCHGPQRPGLAPLPGAEVLGVARVAFHPEHSSCADCHRDPHAGRFSRGGERPFAKDCEACHDHGTFHASTVDTDKHGSFSFPLRGAHRAVPCFECHRELEHDRPAASTLRRAAPTARLLFTAPKRCGECHKDPHGGQFQASRSRGDCRACHGLSSFKPAGRFDHDRHARFRLEGAHERVACASCHPRRALPDGTVGTLYRPIAPHRCQDCHARPRRESTG